MKKKYIFTVLAGLILVVNIPFIFSEYGDWMGPVERTLRSVLNGWDMWATESVRPYENPMPENVPGSVPVDGNYTYPKAITEFQLFDKKQLKSQSKLTYDRFCRHCHGPNGDARVIVGESFGVPIPDLRQAKVQFTGEESLYNKISNGQKNMIPLRETLSPLEILFAIHHIKTLKKAPSVPYYSPKSVAPLN